MKARTWGGRLNDALSRLLLQPTPPGIDFEAAAERVSKGKGGHGTHGARGQAPSGSHTAGLDRPEFLWWVERAECLVLALEREVETNARRQEGVHPAADKQSARKRETDKRITSVIYEGRDPTFVAFLEGRTTDNVQRLRKTAGKDPANGERLSERPLTASMRNQAKAYESNPPTKD